MKPCVALLIALLSLPAAGLQGGSDLQAAFEAASLKTIEPVLNAQGRPTLQPFRHKGGPGTTDPSRLDYTQRLGMLLAEAFEVPQRQVRGPAAIYDILVEIHAAVPPETTVHEGHLMLRNLLVQRFHISYRVETISVRGFALVASKKGPIVSPSTASEARAITPIVYSRDGHPIPQVTGKPGIRSAHENRGWTVAFDQQTMAQFAAYLGERFYAPVEDRTGMTGRFAFTLQFYPPDWGLPSGEDGVKYFPPLRSVMGSKLGLSLQNKKQPGRLIVIEHLDQEPGEN